MLMKTPSLECRLPAPEPELVVKGGNVYANSRAVAAYFPDRNGRPKRHDNVLRDIDALLSGSSDLRNQQFQEVSTFDPAANRVTRSFDMDRDGFALLVMGFKGEVALKFKIAFLKRFREMEEALRQQPRHAPTPAIPGEKLAAALTAISDVLASLRPDAPAQAPIEPATLTSLKVAPEGRNRHFRSPNRHPRTLLGCKPKFTRAHLVAVPTLAATGMSTGQIARTLGLSDKQATRLRNDPAGADAALRRWNL